MPGNGRPPESSDSKLPCSFAEGNSHIRVLGLESCQGSMLAVNRIDARILRVLGPEDPKEYDPALEHLPHETV